MLSPEFVFFLSLLFFIIRDCLHLHLLDFCVVGNLIVVRDHDEPLQFLLRRRQFLAERLVFLLEVVFRERGVATDHVAADLLEFLFGFLGLPRLGLLEVGVEERGVLLLRVDGELLRRGEAQLERIDGGLEVDGVGAQLHELAFGPLLVLLQCLDVRAGELRAEISVLLALDRELGVEAIGFGVLIAQALNLLREGDDVFFELLLEGADFVVFGRERETHLFLDLVDLFADGGG